jgi:hypothetical protein
VACQKGGRCHERLQWQLAIADRLKGLIVGLKHWDSFEALN